MPRAANNPSGPAPRAPRRQANRPRPALPRAQAEIDQNALQRQLRATSRSLRNESEPAEVARAARPPRLPRPAPAAGAAPRARESARAPLSPHPTPPRDAAPTLCGLRAVCACSRGRRGRAQGPEYIFGPRKALQTVPRARVPTAFLSPNRFLIPQPYSYPPTARALHLAEPRGACLALTRPRGRIRTRRSRRCSSTGRRDSPTT